MNGKILDVSDFGSIVMMHVATDDHGIAVVPFDHRAFHWLLDGEQCGADDLIGRSVNYDGDQLAFLDDDA